MKVINGVLKYREIVSDVLSEDMTFELMLEKETEQWKETIENVRKLTENNIVK